MNDPYGIACAVRADINFQVSLPAAGPAPLTEWGQLSSPGPIEGRTLLVLLSGATYDHTYWDMPGIGKKYSFVAAANHAGFATLNLDRLGLGHSSKPAADVLTMQSEADATHQIITNFKSGDMSFLGVGKVILVGHSLGSGIAVQEAGTYHDVDGVVLTGFAHAAGPNLPQVFGNLVEASTDPSLAVEQPQPGYLTIAPGHRDLFYNAADADPRVIAVDEAHRQTVTTGENNSFGALLGNAAISNAITAPVLSIFGAEDRLFDVPGGVPQAEAEHTFFSNAASDQTIVVPRAGHSLQLAENARYTDTRIFDWINRVVKGGPIGGRIVQGGPGADVLAGDGRGNLILGGGGNDTIIAGIGINVLVGGGGADRFIFESGSGQDVILDFNGRQGDRLVVDSMLSYVIDARGRFGMTIRFSNGGSVTLANVAPSAFRTSWILAS